MIIKANCGCRDGFSEDRHGNEIICRTCNGKGFIHREETPFEKIQKQDWFIYFLNDDLYKVTIGCKKGMANIAHQWSFNNIHRMYDVSIKEVESDH